MMAPDAVKGIIIPMVTPFEQNEEIDVFGLRRLIRHIVKAGIHGVLCLGTTGEFARMDDEQIRVVVETTVEEINGRVPVYQGISDCGTRKMLRKIKNAERFGVDALLVTLPFYFPVSSTAEQLVFFERILDSTDVPVVLYNMPQTMGAGIAVAAVEKLSHRPNVVGIKDSSGRLDYLKELLALAAGGDFRVLIGEESISAEGLMMGASGIVPSLGNVFPLLFVDLYEACRRRDAAAARSLQSRIDRINRVSTGCESWLGPISCRKRMLEILGICSARLSQPALELPPAVEREIAAVLTEEQALVQEDRP
ncbi:MAG: dihydrodipicolinate synthase family protein [Spirochaetia bacterium]|jgi:4-hydroxy-tetrahydrodipicolinate synthase